MSGLQPHSESLAGLERDPAPKASACAWDILPILWSQDREKFPWAGRFLCDTKLESRSQWEGLQCGRAAREEPGLLSSQGYFYLTDGHECYLPGGWNPPTCQNSSTGSSLPDSFQGELVSIL